MKSKTTTDLVTCTIKQETTQEICLTPEVYVSTFHRRMKVISSKTTITSSLRLSDKLTKDSAKLTVYSYDRSFNWELEKKKQSSPDGDSNTNEEEYYDLNDVSDFHLDDSDSDSIDKLE